MNSNVAKKALASAMVFGLVFAVSGPAFSQSDADLASENFFEADVDASGSLDFSEFATFIDLNADDELGRASTVRRFGRYGMAFDRADADGDGSVTPEELSSLAQ